MKLNRDGTGNLTNHTPLMLLTDSGSLVSNALGRRDDVKEKRLGAFLHILKEELSYGELTHLIHISGQKQLADPLTKIMDPAALMHFFGEWRDHVTQSFDSFKETCKNKEQV